MNLTPDGALALDGLRAACVTDHTRDEISKLQQCITGWRDKVFLVTGRYAVERFSLSLAKELHASGLSLEVGTAEQPKLKAINAGKHDQS